VSKPTVFTAVGSKRDILKVLREIALAGDDPFPITERAWVQELHAEPNPYRALRLHARGHVPLALRFAQLEEVLMSAAGADDELRELAQANEQQRLEVATIFIDNLM